MSGSRHRRRRGAARKHHFPDPWADLTTRGPDDAGTPLHDQRLDAVMGVLHQSGAASVLDLGCGSGALLRRLVAADQFTRVVGVDMSAEALLVAQRRLEEENAGACSCTLHHGSFSDPEPAWSGFDAAAMVETIEHIPPEHLSRVERSVFATVRPGLVVMTTPNGEYNSLYGMAEGELRHADHKFEWCRSRFREWAAGVAERNGYRVTFEDVGDVDLLLGSPTQMAVFQRQRDES